jgi:hypothetical protein
MNTFKVQRTWRYADSKGGAEDSLILVDGQQIGGVYRAVGNPAQSVGWGWDDGRKRGACWISWGPRGLSCGHRTRALAEQAQVREYATNPDLFDRLFFQAAAEREARRLGEAVLASLASQPVLPPTMSTP